MYNITVMENLPRGFTVLQVFAVDADKGPNAEFNYTLEDPSGGFKIDEKTGWISVRDPTKLDRETQSKIQMKVSALEKKPFSNNRPTTSVEINLLDANDNNPQVINHFFLFIRSFISSLFLPLTSNFLSIICLSLTLSPFFHLFCNASFTCPLRNIMCGLTL